MNLRLDRDLVEYIRSLMQSYIFPWPELVVFVRHAESQSNYETDLIHDGVMTGYSTEVKGRRDMDIDITPLGRKQAAFTQRFLQDLVPEFDVHYRSPFTRTRQTAEIVRPSVTWREDTRLREKDFGLIDQMTDAEVLARYPDVVEMKKRIRKFYFRPPCGENYPDMILRAHSFLGMLKRDYCGKRVLIVAHQAIIMCFRYLLEHLSEEDLIRLQKTQPVDNASVTVYREEKIRGKSRLSLVFPPIAPWQGKV